MAFQIEEEDEKKKKKKEGNGIMRINKELKMIGIMGSNRF